MRERHFGLFTLCAAALLMGALAACAPAAPDLPLTDKDNGKQVTLAIGQELTLALESNPSTGFAWEVADLNAGLLVQVGDPEYKAPQSGAPLVGAAGTQVFHFKAKAAGQVELKLNYRRAWEKDVPPAKTYTVTLTIR